MERGRATVELRWGTQLMGICSEMMSSYWPLSEGEHLALRGRGGANL